MTRYFANSPIRYTIEQILAGNVTNYHNIKRVAQSVARTLHCGIAWFLVPPEVST